MNNRSRWQFALKPLVATVALTWLPMVVHADMSPMTPDEALVESLQNEEAVRAAALQDGLPGLTPEEIRTLRRLLNEQEAARNNPEPPMVANKVIMLSRGESPTIQIMERFDTTIMFTDRHGDPIEIVASRINDEQAARLVPIRSNDSARAVTASTEAPSDPDIVMPVEEAGAETSQGAVTGIIISPEAPMRSTNITVMLRGQSHPIVLTVSTRSSLNTEDELAYIQELRLNWVSNMPQAQALAGKFSGVGGNTSLSGAMLSLVQGVPTPNMTPRKLEGDLATQVGLWYDEVDEIWYLRMAEHIDVWNVSIADRTRDGLRGYTVAKLNGPPPRLIDMSANGRFTTLTVSGD